MKIEAGCDLEEPNGDYMEDLIEIAKKEASEAKKGGGLSLEDLL